MLFIFVFEKINFEYSFDKRMNGKNHLTFIRT